MTETVGRLVTLVGAVLSVAAMAQTAPTVAPFPLDFSRGDPAGEADALRSDFREQIRKAGVQLPSGAELKAAFSELKRTDCDVENACLTAFATKAGALYGLYASVDIGIKVTVVTGRVVRADGKEFGRVQALTAPTPAKKTGAVRGLLQQLVTELKLGDLPPTRGTEVVTPAPADAGVPAVVAVTPVVPPDAGVSLPPPPPPPALDSPLKPVGIVTAVTGGALAVTGLIALVVGRGQALSSFDESGALRVGADVMAAQNARTLQGVGVGLLSGGAAAAAVGLVLTMLAPGESKPVVSFVPAGGGGVVLLSGELP
ncbi:MAG: hypothetical protein MUC96_00850 [Myxococcaceae bacterium]|nr:hypothetical protein [Myxococcaceae bacterium]